MNAYLWLYVVVIALCAMAAIRARRDGEYTWAVGIGVTAVLLPPVGAVLAYAYVFQVRRRRLAED